MSPNATKLVVTDHMVPSHAQRIGNFPLLFYREKNIALDSEDQGRGVRKGAKTLCKFW